MSSIVENSVSGGVDLNSLTSGERLLLGMLVNNQWSSFYWTQEWGRMYQYSNADGYTLDLSKIRALSFDLYVAPTSSTTVNIQIYTWQGSYASILVSVRNTGGYISTSTRLTPLSITLPDPSTKPTDDYTHGSIKLSTSSQNAVLSYNLLSFTTTDGKVHTASNLNY